MNKYFYNINGENKGPFTLDEIKEKGLKPDDYVWRDDMDNWSQAKFIEELKESLVIIPPKLEVISPPKLEIPNQPIINKKNNDEVNTKNLISKKSNFIFITFIIVFIFSLLFLPFSCYEYECYNGITSVFIEHNPTILPIVFFNVILLIILLIKKIDKSIITLLVIVQIISLILLFLNYYWILNEGNSRGIGLYLSIICSVLTLSFTPKKLNEIRGLQKK